MTDARLRDLVDRVLLTVGGPRRLLAALCAAVAVLLAVQAATPPPARTVAVWAAARDLPGGSPLTTHDVRVVALPAGTVPDGALRTASSVVGRLLAAPVRRGEALTDVRLLGQSLLTALPDPGLVAVPVRVADGSAAAALVHPGDVVDVLAVGDPEQGGSGRPTTVAAAVRVLAVPVRLAASGDSGGLVVVAVDRAQAAALARASAAARLSLALRRS
ncbi:MAG TPA: Flp pilus assembly protein CpaB [Mycobacteriales bacterium]|nr:Flp pilus assembly protein CpaB [Mycobacteriales bacterium]